VAVVSWVFALRTILWLTVFQSFCTAYLLCMDERGAACPSSYLQALQPPAPSSRLFRGKVKQDGRHAESISPSAKQVLSGVIRSEEPVCRWRTCETRK